MLATIPDDLLAAIVADALTDTHSARTINADPADWRAWLAEAFPAYTRHPFADRHADFWTWVVALRPGVRPQPLVAIWPRGGAKSTTAELAACNVGISKRRRYVLYVSDTQEQADKHVATVASMFEALDIERAVNKYGSSKGWRRNRLRTAGGYTVDSLGFDVAVRGIKVDEQRPDLIILDDIDNLHDSPAVVQKKIETLTQTILPSGSDDCAVVFVQNLIRADGIVARMADGRADFLVDRIVSGPFKAVDGDFAYEAIDGRFRITSGTPSWAGQSIATCEGFMNTWGPRAFIRECQQDVKIDAEGALWRRQWIDAARIDADSKPEFDYIITAVDPSKTGSADSDECGIVTVARAGMDGYVIDDRSLIALPLEWGKRAVLAYHRNGSHYLKYESNLGGLMVESVIRSAAKELGLPEPVMHGVPTTVSKGARAEPASVLYESGHVHHVGVFPELEDEQVTWDPRVSRKSPNRIDALVLALNELGLIAGSGFGFGVLQ